MIVCMIVASFPKKLKKKKTKQETVTTDWKVLRNGESTHLPTPFLTLIDHPQCEKSKLYFYGELDLP